MTVPIDIPYRERLTRELASPDDGIRVIATEALLELERCVGPRRRDLLRQRDETGVVARVQDEGGRHGSSRCGR
jgi:hypothetical protein